MPPTITSFDQFLIMTMRQTTAAFMRSSTSAPLLVASSTCYLLRSLHPLPIFLISLISPSSPPRPAPPWPRGAPHSTSPVHPCAHAYFFAPRTRIWLDVMVSSCAFPHSVDDVLHTFGNNIVLVAVSLCRRGTRSGLSKAIIVRPGSLSPL